jgi:hypothetical protein
MNVLVARGRSLDALGELATKQTLLVREAGEHLSAALCGGTSRPVSLKNPELEVKGDVGGLMHHPGADDANGGGFNQELLLSCWQI